MNSYPESLECNFGKEVKSALTKKFINWRTVHRITNRVNKRTTRRLHWTKRPENQKIMQKVRGRRAQRKEMNMKGKRIGRRTYVDLDRPEDDKENSNASHNTSRDVAQNTLVEKRGNNLKAKCEKKFQNGSCSSAEKRIDRGLKGTPLALGKETRIRKEEQGQGIVAKNLESREQKRERAFNAHIAKVTDKLTDQILSEDETLRRRPVSEIRLLQRQLSDLQRLPRHPGYCCDELSTDALEHERLREATSNKPDNMGSNLSKGSESEFLWKQWLLKEEARGSDRENENWNSPDWIESSLPSVPQKNGKKGEDKRMRKTNTKRGIGKRK